MVKKKNIAFNVAMGAAFLMAMSAVGPGFLTQTAAFTGQLGADFGFAILICILVDIGVQLNIWRIICVSGKKAQTVANELVPGLGYLLTALIVMGGLTFNIGNIGGVGLGFNVLFGISPENGALIGGAIALVIFLVRNALIVMDRTVQVLAVVKVLLIIFIVAISSPPVGQAALHTFVPSHIDFYSIVTIVGGTVGGYISFSGGHRLLEGGLRGKESIRYINAGALTGIGVASIIRILLFLAALAVIAEGYKLNPLNPAASIFQSAAGNFGYKFFGLILLAAGMTSTLGSTFTSVSFLDYSKSDDRNNFYHKLRPYLIIFFIVFSTAIFYFIGSPAKVLVMVGAINGLILPIALAILLVAVTKKKIMGELYKHPLWLTIFGWIIVVFMAYAGVQSVIKGFSSLF
ncbi:NRAMP family divalent metal transporter [Sporolactobacillus laevolacticus]|uniref:Membrane protein n=1 Tax=Sporolactobacillus laevolacticus DSM 442 TaxID=1395513 RepID=V6IX27_9BACL|nr:NRAMP family divalent metal transporter [Sporolactobacillus laevolacticus]EST11862.1 membrane protein [Sporolactobacillus laevolacticus DSM 442]MDN3955101.1 divalent metal cation transporter [Sporolactobacillus laevolacticus]